MYEYERASTTVANSTIRPRVAQYLSHLEDKIGDTDLKVLRSDGGTIISLAEPRH